MHSLWWIAVVALHFFKVAFRFFFRPVLIQNPAHTNNFISLQKVSTHLVAFLSLIRIRLPAHERASGWSQSGGSHTQIQSTSRRAPAGYTPVAITCPSGSRSETAISLTHTVSADITCDIVPALPDCECPNCCRLTLLGLTASAAAVCRSDSAARGKISHISMLNKTSYVYIVRIHRMLHAICTHYIVFHVHYRFISTLLSHIVYNIENLRCRIRRRTRDWQQQSFDVLYSTF
jgi:hypothetical protein